MPCPLVLWEIIIIKYFNLDQLIFGRLQVARYKLPYYLPRYLPNARDVGYNITVFKSSNSLQIYFKWERNIYIWRSLRGEVSLCNVCLYHIVFPDGWLFRVQISISAGCSRGGCAISLFTICLQLREHNKNLVNIVLQFCPHIESWNDESS